MYRSVHSYYIFRGGTRSGFREEFSLTLFHDERLSNARLAQLDRAVREFVPPQWFSVNWRKANRWKLGHGEEDNRTVSEGEVDSEVWFAVVRHELIRDGEIIESDTLDSIDVRPRQSLRSESLSIVDAIREAFARAFGAE